jgi:hypothetical protein
MISSQQVSHSEQSSEGRFCPGFTVPLSNSNYGKRKNPSEEDADKVTFLLALNLSIRAHEAVEVSDQVHAPGALAPKEYSLPIRWVPGSVLTLWRKDSRSLAGNRTSVALLASS